MEAEFGRLPNLARDRAEVVGVCGNSGQNTVFGSERRQSRRE